MSTWYEQIGDPHIRFWSRLVRAEYVANLRTYRALKSLPMVPITQLRFYDNSPLSAKSAKRVCHWPAITEAAIADGYNPLHIVRQAFAGFLLRNCGEYPRPPQVMSAAKSVPGTNPRSLAEHYEGLVECQLRSDVAFTQRCRESVETLVDAATSPEQMQQVTLDLLAENIGSPLVRAALFSSAAPTAEVIREFLTAPDIYVGRIPHLIQPALLKLRKYCGSVIAK